AADVRVGARARVAGCVGEVRVDGRDGPVVRVEPQVLLGVAGDADAVDGRVEGEAEARSREGGDEGRGAHLARRTGARIDDVEAAGLPEAVQLPVERPHVEPDDVLAAGQAGDRVHGRDVRDVVGLEGDDPVVLGDAV